LPPKKYIPPTFPVAFSKPPTVAIDLGISQAAATAAPAPAPAPGRKQIDPHTNPGHDWYKIAYDEPEALIDEDFEATVDSIVLAGNDYCVLTRLQSGRIRTDRRSASPEEIELLARDTRRRQTNRYSEMGSSQTGDETPPTSPSTSEEKHT
jgi:hypothetical protein